MTQNQFEQFYKETYSFIYGYVSARTFHKYNIEDIIQETYYAAFLHKETLLNHANPEGWLVMIAKNRIFKYGQRELRDINTIERRYNFSECMSTNYQESQYGLCEVQDVLQRHLTEEEQVMFNEFYVAGYSGEELEKKYKVSKSCLKMRLKRIREKIKCYI